MTLQITTVAEAVKDSGLKGLVFGGPGSGKTQLLATTGESTLIISAEGGLRTIKNAPDNIKTVKIEKIEDLNEIYEMLEEGMDFKWVMLDSISEIAEKLLAKEKSLTKDPRGAYGELITKMSVALRGFRDLPNYNVIMVAKEVMTVDENTGLSSYQPMMPGAKLGQALPYMFDLVGAMKIGKTEDGIIYHYLQTSPDMSYRSLKYRGEGLNDIEEPNLGKLLRKLNGQKKVVKKPEVKKETVQSTKENK